MSPNYSQLLVFLLKPLLEQPQALKLHEEVNQRGDRFWLRVAISPSDRQRIMGKGGKTLQLIRTVLLASAKNAGHSINLELYDAGRNA